MVSEADGGALEPVDWADWRVVRRRLGTTSALGASASLPTAPRRVAPSAVASSGSTALGGDSDDDASSVSSGVTVASALSWRAAYDEEGPGGRHRVPIAQMGNFLTVSLGAAHATWVWSCSARWSSHVSRQLAVCPCAPGVCLQASAAQPPHRGWSARRRRRNQHVWLAVHNQALAPTRMASHARLLVPSCDVSLTAARVVLS